MYFHDASGEDFGPSSGSLLIWSIIKTQWYSRWNMSNCMLSEEKSKQNWSMLMSSQDITLLLYPVMSKCRYPVSTYSNIFPIKVNDITIKIVKIQELSSPKGE